MLAKLFVFVLNMSLISSYVIVFVLIARVFLKKAPKIFSYALWCFALFRLICPFSFESVLSLIPIEKAAIPQDIIYSSTPLINTGIVAFDSLINPILPLQNNVDSSVSPIQILLFIGAVIWVIGMLVMVIYSVISYIKLKRSLNSAALFKSNIYLSHHIPSPFVMGLFKPKIYLPSALNISEKDFIIAHEMCHIRRFDHVTRILGFAALTVHWFNPLVWIAFIASAKDMEMSCDETVMKQMNTDIRKEYSQSLLRFGAVKKVMHATPLAFGEGNTKTRILNVLSYKKPAFFVIIILVIAVVAVGIGLITNPKAPVKTAELDDIPSQGITGEVLKLNNGDIQLSIYNLADYPELGSVNEGFAYLEKATNMLHVGITTAFGQPKATNSSPVGSLAGAKLEFDMDMTTEKLLNSATPLNSENVMLEISDDTIISMGKKMYEFIMQSQKQSYSLMTVDNSPIDVHFLVNNNDELDTLQMLSQLDKSDNRLKAENILADEKYIKFNFANIKKPKSIYIRYVASVDDIWQENYPIDNDYKIKLPTKDGIYSFFADIIWENGTNETAYFGVTVGATSPLAITKGIAKEFINQTLSTFTLNSDNTVSFKLPPVIPIDLSGKTKLYISSNATFSAEPNSNSVQEILDWKDGWQGGENYTAKLDMPKEKLTHIFLRVAFMVSEGENSYSEYAANYIELTEPFKFDTPIKVQDKSVAISETAASSVLKYTMQDGSSFSVALALPKGFSVSTDENYLQDTVTHNSDFTTIAVVKDKKGVGTLVISDLGTYDKDVLSQINTAENALPMQIFAPIALSNHAQFDNYKVSKSSATGANAVADYSWQDLTDYGGRAPSAPWLKSNAVLAYDYEKARYLVYINLTENALTGQELENLAKSIVITG